MAEEQIKNTQIQKKREKRIFAQKELFQYWNPKYETNHKVLSTKSQKPIPGHLVPFYDTSEEINHEVLRLFHTNDTGTALVGGAGTGKTSLITSLAGHMIRENVFLPENVLIIIPSSSDTEKYTLAVSQIAGNKSRGVQITGFDEFSLMLLSRIFGHLPRIFNTYDRKHFISLMFPFLGKEDIETLSLFIESPDKNIKIDTDEDIHYLRDTYIDTLTGMKICDKGILPIQAELAAVQNPGIIHMTRRQYKCVFIDNLHHMNNDKFSFLSRILLPDFIPDSEHPQSRKIVVSVDPFQADLSIHGKKQYHNFMSNYIQHICYLQKSWRVPGRIMRSVTRLFTKKKGKKKYIPATYKNPGTHILLFKASKIHEEIDFITHTILSYIEKSRDNFANAYVWGDFGILSRTSEYLDLTAAALVRKHIPFVRSDRQSSTENLSLHHINSLLHFIHSEKDVTSFADILLHLLPDFTVNDVKNIFLAGNRKGEHLSQLIQRLYQEHQLKENQYNEIIRLINIRKNVKKEISRAGIFEGIQTICKNFPRIEMELMNYPEEQKIYLNHACSCGNNIKKFLLEQFTIFSNRTNCSSRNKVFLSPFHPVMNKEVPILFIPGMEEGLCPLYTTTMDIETETALFYSAITKAKKQVYLSYSEERDGTINKKSSFITGMGPHIKEINPVHKRANNFEQADLFN